jgi:hypothetical protein
VALVMKNIFRRVLKIKASFIHLKMLSHKYYNRVKTFVMHKRSSLFIHNMGGKEKSFKRICRGFEKESDFDVTRHKH